MYIRFWGTRGSIPTPGPTTVRYGGNTACVEVRDSTGALAEQGGEGVREAPRGRRGVGRGCVGKRRVLVGLKEAGGVAERGRGRGGPRREVPEKRLRGDLRRVDGRRGGGGRCDAGGQGD